MEFLPPQKQIRLIGKARKFIWYSEKLANTTHQIVEHIFDIVSMIK